MAEGYQPDPSLSQATDRIRPAAFLQATWGGGRHALAQVGRAPTDGPFPALYASQYDPKQADLRPSIVIIGWPSALLGSHQHETKLTPKSRFGAMGSIADGPPKGGFSLVLQNPYLCGVASFSTLGGLLFGYDQGVISGVITMESFAARCARMKKQRPRRLTSVLGDDRGSTRSSIVVLGSAASYVGMRDVAPYTAAKHAVVGMVKTAGKRSQKVLCCPADFNNGHLALDNIPHGIRVNAVCPSFVNTPGVTAAIESDCNLAELVAKMHPMGRIANVEEVADAVVFLCSDRFSYITGQGLVVDGGSTLGSHV
ncbi:uncharacterized protein DSM5745_08593 [Aspergillus mulundensis]|uniref:Uncharacterized protein n=1 Tax=Aspergillus mulundensis TaxID=1810919 RepID=A0A3D8R443_9EURO|nr:hypothetical protein DSM5745_08593 [Aspergillus mulundensis]RDW68833.1 hypothetical protein DSM5745_08593 [Aspergillus mulundensis]